VFVDPGVLQLIAMLTTLSYINNLYNISDYRRDEVTARDENHHARSSTAARA
jgi:hypothetical protein